MACALRVACLLAAFSDGARVSTSNSRAEKLKPIASVRVLVSQPSPYVPRSSPYAVPEGLPPGGSVGTHRDGIRASSVGPDVRPAAALATALVSPWARRTTAKVVRRATPREVQFGMARRKRRRRSTVAINIPQLFVAGVNAQLEVALAGEEHLSDDVIEAFTELCEVAAKRAPTLISTWDGGVAALFRIAVVAPRTTWLRPLSDVWVSKQPHEDVMRSLLLGERTSLNAHEALLELLRHLFCKDEHSPLGSAAGGFTWSDGGGVGYHDGQGADLVLSSGSALRLALRFARLSVALASGEAAVKAAKEYLTPALTKKMVRTFMTRFQPDDVPHPPALAVPDDVHFSQPDDVRLSGPLAQLRAAQVSSMGGPERLARAAALFTRLGNDLGSAQDEAFALNVLEWACRFADAPELSDERSAGQCMEWLLSERVADPSFAIVLHGKARSPKKVHAAAKRAAMALDLQRLQTTGERFEPNSARIKPFVRRDIEATFDQECIVAFSELRAPSSWHGDQYEVSKEEEMLLSSPSSKQRATVRIDEILSFEYLQNVGATLQNCLQAERRGGSSLMKYLSRARAGESSYWAMTLTAEDTEVAAAREKELLSRAEHAFNTSSKERADYEMAHSKLEAKQQETQAELNRTFFLNLRKKFRLRKMMRELNQSIDEIDAKLVLATDAEKTAASVFRTQQEASARVKVAGEASAVEFLLLIEVYNGLRVIHQAEGPHPRRWPRKDAWAWLREWAEEQDLRPDGPEGVTVGPYGYDGKATDPWDINRCFLW